MSPHESWTRTPWCRYYEGLQHLVVALVSVVLLFSVAACSSSSPASDGGAAEAATAPAADSDTDSVPTAVDPVASGTQADTATAAPASSPAPASRLVLARGEGNVPGTAVEVTGLTRGADGMVTLTFTLVNELGVEEIGGYDLTHPDHQIADFGTVGGVHLLDGRTMTKIEVDRGPDGRCLCSRRISVQPGGRLQVWAKYSALDPATARVSVIVAGFEPIDDVPVTPASVTVAAASPSTPIRSAGHAAGTWIEVTDLSRGSDGFITVKFTLVNELGVAEIGGYDLTHPDHEIADFATVGGVYLLDGRSMIKWDVGRDTSGKCVCSEGVGVKPGQRLRAWAKFSSVSAETAAVTIVVPGFEPVENVAIGAGPTT